MRILPGASDTGVHNVPPPLPTTTNKTMRSTTRWQQTYKHVIKQLNNGLRTIGPVVTPPFLYSKWPSVKALWRKTIFF